MGYFAYYLGFMVLAFVLQRPPLMLGVVVFFLLRPFLPDPVVLLRTFGRARTLSRQVEANPANVTARRDLAMLWLERLRPRRALELLVEASRRDPDNAEILYLTGLALLRSGEPEAALPPVVRAVELDPRVRFGEPYLVAGMALLRLKRFAEAEDALDRYVGVNSSTVEGYYLLAKARAEQGDGPGAKQALAEARSTFWQLPGRTKREQLGFYALALLASVWS